MENTNPISLAETLEKLYRENRTSFHSLYSELCQKGESELLNYWKIRLQYEETITGRKTFTADFIVVIAITIITFLLVKIPQIFGINQEIFYLKNLSVIVLNGIILYTFRQQITRKLKHIAIYFTATAILLLFLNLLPDTQGDSLIMSYMHVSIFMWFLFAMVYVSFDYRNPARLNQFIRFNGELFIMNGILFIAGAALSGITIILFEALKLDIREFYINNFVVLMSVGFPVLSFYIIQLYPDITRKIAPVVARIFAPIMLITLITYLISMVFTRARITQDREILIIFNAVLLIVLAIIIFSVSEYQPKKSKNTLLVLTLLDITALIVNAIALYAIVTRIGYGMTPNRLVVLISNILIFIHLIIMAIKLASTCLNNQGSVYAQRAISAYLPVYFVYSIFVVFILPFIFSFK